MDYFNIVIDDKERRSCAKRDKVYVELDNSTARSGIDCIELKHLIESCNIQK